MTESEIEAMHFRLAHLERRQRQAAYLVVGLLVGVGLLGANERTPPTVEGKEFVLRDAQGRMRAALAMRPDGTPGLGLFDERGRVRLSMELAVDASPSVHCYDGQGQLQAALAVRPDGTPGLGLFSGGPLPRVSLDLRPDGAAGLNLFGRDGALRGAFALRTDNTPGVGLWDDQGRLVRALEAEDVPPAPSPLR